MPELVARVCRAAGIRPDALQQGSRRAGVACAREGIAYLAVEVCGYPGPSLVPVLGVRLPSIYKAAQRGRAAQAQWDVLLTPR